MADLRLRMTAQAMPPLPQSMRFEVPEAKVLSNNAFSLLLRESEALRRRHMVNRALEYVVIILLMRPHRLR